MTTTTGRRDGYDDDGDGDDDGDYDDDGDNLLLSPVVIQSRRAHMLISCGSLSKVLVEKG